MQMTLTEKILAKKCGKKKVFPGEIVIAKIDVICVDEIQIPIFMETLEKMGTASLMKDRVVLVADHYCPPTTFDQAKGVKMIRDFGRAHRLGVLEGGIKHQLLIENGIAKPGIIIVATDSHINTCGAVGALAAPFGPSEAAMMAVTGECWLRVPETIRIELIGELQPFVMPRDIGFFVLGEKGSDFANYKAVEFSGETIRALNMDGRITLCNMSTEMGAKNGIIDIDEVTESFLKGRNVSAYEKMVSDNDALYSETLSLDVSKLQPMVAVPHSPSNVRPVHEVVGTPIDQVFIGSCIGGNLEDLRMSARILKGSSVAPQTRLIITPASRETYIKANAEGLIDTFLKAGAIVSGMTCSACVGLEAPLLQGEVCISTSTRNFRGRMGSPDASIYLGSSATAAASAIEGKLTDPREFL